MPIAWRGSLWKPRASGQIRGGATDFTMRFALINGLPGVIVDAPEGPVQTAAIEIEGGVIRALYVVRNPDKLRHLKAASPQHDNPLRHSGSVDGHTQHERIDDG